MKITDQAQGNEELKSGWINSSKYSSSKMKHNNISKYRKFNLLMWKNWLIQRRRKKQTVLEIFYSIIFCIILVIIRDLAPSDTHLEPTTYTPFSVNFLPEGLRPADNDLFSSIIEYFSSSRKESSSRRKKRRTDIISSFPALESSISSLAGSKGSYFDPEKNKGSFFDPENKGSFFDPEKALSLPKIKQFIDKNPTKENLVRHLLDLTEQWVQRKWKLYRRKKGKQKRAKRFLSILNWFSGDPAWPIAYTPNNTAVREVMDYVSDYLYLDTGLYGFATEEEMISHLTSFSLDPGQENNTFFGLQDVLGGIVFTNDFVNNSFPRHIKYKIRLKGSPRYGKKLLSFAPPPRWNTELTYPVFQIPGPRNRDKNEGGDPGYFEEGFLAIQFAIDRSIANYMKGKEIDSWVSLKMQRMPYPPYIDDMYLVALQAWLPLILLLSFIYPSMNIVRNVVHEKENKLKESMKMMGLDNWLHWSAWFVKSLIFFLATSLLVTLLLCTRWNGSGSLAVLDNSDPTLVFFFLFVYNCCTISFCCFLSTLHSRANSGAMAVLVIWMFSYIPNIYLRPRFLSLSTRLKIGLSLYFNTAMSLGCFLTSMFEGTGSGIQWHLISSGVSPDSPFSLAHVFAMMVLDAAFYGVLTWYIEAIFPGEFGVPLPWNFPFKKEYWCGYETANIPSGIPPPATNEIYFEPDPVGLASGIRIKGLTKAFSKEKVAVNNMYLNMYANQITVLLGHNGAGKTTTMSMLTGLFPPTRGTAEVNGFDIVNNMTEVRSSIGICPQHDVLFDELTVIEHIKFFTALKGLPEEDVAGEVSHILTGIKLLDKANSQAKTLSGGMKRKLSVGVALCGRSRVVILDEPTTGMDPGARRIIWDLLQNERNGRTMLLTTHFMEEADLLGDRIAIMTNGIIQCCGSSIFLKKTYGAGYHLTLVKERDCNAAEVQQLITAHIPEAEVELNVAAELSFILPNDKVANFEPLFTELENRRKELKISSYGASQTTMEEVFLRVGEDSNPEVKDFLNRGIPKEESRSIANSPAKNSSEDDGSLLTFEIQETPNAADQDQVNFSKSNGLMRAMQGLIHSLIDAKALFMKQIGSDPIMGRRIPVQHNSGVKLILQQCRAMFVKKALYTFRNPGITAAQILIPVAFLIIAMFVLRNLPGVNDSPPEFVASPNVYDGIKIPVQDLSNSSISNTFMNYYTEQFKKKNKVVLLQQPSVNLSSYLLQRATNDLPTFNLHWLLGLKVSANEDSSFFSSSSEASKLNIISFFNNQPYHVPPMALNLVGQSLVRSSTGMPDLTITTSNHPLPRTDTEKLTQESRQNIGFNIGFNLAFGMSFLSSSFVLFVIKERSSNCKHLQFVSGVNFVIYWLATAIWDFLCFLITCLLVLTSLYFYKEEGLSEGPQLGRILLVLILYAWAILPFMYIASFYFTVPSSGFTRMAVVHILIGMTTLITVTILRIPDLELQHVADILDWLFLLFPPYAMASAIGDLYSNVRFTNICSRDVLQFLCALGTFKNPCCLETGSCGPFGCVYWTEDLLGWKKLGVGRMLTFLAVEGLVFYAVIATIELKWHRSLKYIFTSLYKKLFCKMTFDAEGCVSEEEDADIRAERHRIQNGPLEELFKTDKLILRDLTKKYSNGVLAVDHLNLGVPLGECFGLLGINGAGKTTTFKMLTGDLPVSNGDAYVNGFSVKSNIKKVQQQIGYCPQFDALLDQMTGRETLRMFARLRGVPEAQINECIRSIADQLLVTQYLDKQVGRYSGGNRRKISTGIALIGDPPLILLDEPTSGMDPVARRHLWDVLNSVRDTGRSIILTSHSMEECEALCTRLAIMTNGSFRCLGSPQHLKSKFSEGYSIIIRVSLEEYRDAEEEVSEMPPEMARVQQFILSTFKESFLREMQWGRLEYFVPAEAATWSEIFGILEKNKEDFDIEDYSVTQTTLERVFLNFTRNQRPDKNE